ncbi:MAG TPA: NosD domain-containing protein, partial [Chthoniobacterales bacterium]|nr:NosD domain-containing protein [Chthoniobacterales bacterium]
MKMKIRRYSTPAAQYLCLVGATLFASANFSNAACTPPAATVYVNAAWVGTTPGGDPDGTGPATDFGCDAFATIQDGVNGVATGGTVNVYQGTYDEDVTLNKAGVSLLGIDAGDKTIRGVIGGGGATLQVLASNVTIAGFTITRLGNNTTDWNNPGLNSAGVAIQGLAITGTQIYDNTITGNRTGVDVNNSNGHTIRNNVIDFNRTGLIFRNQTDEMSVVENFITNNWTVGVLFLDASGGTNSPVQSALHSGFNNNNLSANWYGQIVDRQTGGSLPAPGTTNLKNFRGDWFGTTAPVITTANSAEPGYAAQIPVAYGGSATPPGGQPDIAGPASANFQINPILLSGTDTNVETTPGRGTFGFQGVANSIVVTEANPQGWVFFDDAPGTGTGSGGFEPGPG